MQPTLFFLPTTYVIAALLSHAWVTAGQATTEIQGEISIICMNGTCTFNEECINLDSVPGTLLTNSSLIEYTDIDGEFLLEPASCQAECSNCLGIPGSDQDEGGCIVSAGYVYCPETDECIRPWENNCPFEGASFIGPVDIFCSSGSRCNSVSEDCEISVGSFTIGGFYLTGLVGNYTLPDGCAAICQGCTCEGCPPEGNNPNGDPIEQSGANDTNTEPTDDTADAGSTTRAFSWCVFSFLGYILLVLL